MIRALLSVFALLIAHVASGATYFIDFVGGSDANNGTSTGTAWKRHPYMATWAGSYSHSAGDQFKFKGGVTWPASCFQMTAAAGGSVGAGNDYYGVDQTWYTGGAWTRPVFDGEYTANTLFYLNTIQRITIDNIEFKRLNALGDGYGMIGGGAGSTIDNILIQNCYFHGWRTSLGSDSAHGAVIFMYGASPTITSVVIDNCTIENSENSGSGTQNGVAVRQIRTVKNSTIHDVSSAVLFTGDFHHNTLYNVSYPSTNESFDGAYHTNGIYVDNGGASTSYVYANYIYNISAGANQIYLNPHGGQTQYAYNNLIYGVQSAQLPISIDTYNYGSGDGGNVVCYNNTIVNYASSSEAIHIVTLGVDRPILVSLIAINNHVIGTSASLSNAVQSTNVTTYTTSNSLIQTAAAASAQGYALGNLYAPTSTGGSTYNAGISEAGTFTVDILAVARPQATIWDIGCYEFAGAGASGSSVAGRVTIGGSAKIQ